MDGVGGVPGSAVRFVGPHAAGETIIRGGFRPNGASNPTIFRGPMASGKLSDTTLTAAGFTVAYSATGIFTVTLTATGFKFPSNDPPFIQAQSTMVDVTNTNRFDVKVVGLISSRAFVLKCFQADSAFAPPSDAGNWIDFIIFAGTKY